MEDKQETCPKGGSDFVSDKVNFKTEEEDDDQIPCHSLEQVDFKSESEDMRQTDSGDEQADIRAASCACQPSGKFLAAESEDDYGSLFSQYSSTLYNVAMEAVTQSLLSSRHISSRKKSPAWKHFFISPRDSTKAICTYCMKEFSRGKNEKDLSTSCLMRHVRRAHPTKLIQENGSLSAGSSFSPPSLLLPPQPADVGDLSTVLSPVRLVQKMAPKIPSPDQIMEESVTVVSSEEVSSDVSVTEKYSREEALAGSSPNLSMLHYDDTSETMADRNLSLPKSTSGSRRRSAVWKHFYLSPLDSSKAVCVHCMNEFSRGKNGKDLGTSCLIRHMWRAHRSIVLQENGGNTGIPPLYPMPPTLLPALLPPEGDLNSASLSPGKQVKESPSASSSPDRLPEDLSSHTNPGDVSREDVSMLSSSDDLGEASVVSSPEKQPADTVNPRFESGTVFQQNKKVMRRLKSEVWHHFSLAPMDNLKAVCRYCSCAISRKHTLMIFSDHCWQVS